MSSELDQYDGMTKQNYELLHNAIAKKNHPEYHHIEIEDIAELARIRTNEDYGSDNQINAINTLTAEVENVIPDKHLEKLNSFALKATNLEYIEYAVKLYNIANEAYCRLGVSYLDLSERCDDALNRVHKSYGMKPVEDSKEQKELDLVQFARLIDELAAAGAFTDEVVETMSASMGLSIAAIEELAKRAEQVWEDAKEK